MIDIITLQEVRSKLRNELSNNIHYKDEMKDEFHRLCVIIGEVEVLIKLLKKK